MIFCRFNDDGEAKYGLVENHQVREISPDPFSDFEIVGDPVPFAVVQFLAPAQPSKIVAVGVNYKKHAKEMNHDLPQEPLIFLKPSSAVIGSLETIHCPAMSDRVDYEGELAAVIKKKTKNISAETAQDYILGYTCFNDVTARDLQKKDSQWSRAKGFDTFAPMGPWIVSDLDVSDLTIETYLNGELKQNGRTSDMVFSVTEIVSYISKIMTLMPGDVITTGTPEGIGPLAPGDTVDVRIEGIGTLRNSVEKAENV